MHLYMEEGRAIWGWSRQDRARRPGNPQSIVLFDVAGPEPGAHLSCHYETTAAQVGSVGLPAHEC